MRWHLRLIVSYPVSGAELMCTVEDLEALFVGKN
jgi:hypothetical protein